MPFAAALSEHPVPAEAVGEALGQVLERVGPEPDLAALFVTAPVAGALGDLGRAVRSVLAPRTLLGATAVSVLGGTREVEDKGAVALWAGRLAGAAPVPVRAQAVPVDGGARVEGLPAPPPGATLLLVADPFSFPVDGVLAQLRRDQPDLTVVGGLASAARGPGGNRLLIDDEIHTDGAVGALLEADVAVTPVVSQGCRPLGEPMIVTQAEGNMIRELAGRPALNRLVELVESASEEDRALLQSGLHVGIVVDEHRETFGRGDFLVRNVLGADRNAEAIAVGDVVPVGATVQFHVRDAGTADEDLRSLLDRAPDAAGALVFTCNGRGTNLFGGPDHDARVVGERVGGACAGMFCAGELGPIGGRSFLHGFTASVALFRD